MNKEYQVIFTMYAFYDLKHIEQYVDGLDPSIFYSLFEKIKKHISLLEIQPYINAVFITIDGIDYRRIIVNGYVVVYDINNNEVYIDRIFHHLENYDRKLR